MSFFDPCISVLVGGWRNGESVLFRFLCKLIAGLINFSWPRPSPSPWRSLPDGGSHAEGAEYSGSEWEAGQEVGARQGRGAGGTAGLQLAPTRHDVTRPQNTLEQIPPFLQFAGSSGSGGLCSSNPFSRVWPYLHVHYHCQNWPLVSLQGWLGMRRPVCCCDGAGVLFFSKLPLMFV